MLNFNGGNNGQALKNVTCKQALTRVIHYEEQCMIYKSFIFAGDLTGGRRGGVSLIHQVVAYNEFG